MGKVGPYYSVMTAVHGGMSFDNAFSKAYGGSPTQAVTSWAQRGGGKR
jgi:hypothetical protein